MALFLILSLMDCFGEFSSDLVWKSLEVRHVNSTGILYVVKAATFTTIQTAVRLYMCPNHSEALFFIFIIIIDSYLLAYCFQCVSMQCCVIIYILLSITNTLLGFLTF